MLFRPDLLGPLALFCAVTLITPGPNNFMLMASGLTFGLRRSLPHMIGVALGFPLLVFCVALGLGGIIRTFPVFYSILRYAGAIYMLYLAWIIATSDARAKNPKTRKRPLTFIETVSFQWINPKAWIMAVGATSTYDAVANYPWNAFLIALFFCVLGFGSSFTWLSLGSSLEHFLKEPKLVRAFNIIMALLLVASIYPVLVE